MREFRPLPRSRSRSRARGEGEPAREDALASLEGMLWRVLVVWMIVFLLSAALHLA